ncbi:MAG: dTDP-glucose 4,6-dehydratase [Candidatus Peribacteraceae bacterium]|nr:dTDP-glucose 4,6-dehydratase [Candidatus Peribacteraceae bacterium]
MNLLVTGGAGFIGSHFVLRHIAQRPDDTVVVLDKLTYAADKEFLDPVNERIRFYKGDIIDVQVVSEIIRRYDIDAIVNFAAETHVDRSIADPIPFLHTNILGMQSLIEVCKLFPKTLLLHISTDEVYGDLEDGERARKPDDPLTPSSPYAASKAAGDLLLLAAVRTYGIRARITRCTNNYGPHQASEKFIPTVIRNALAGKPVPIYATGKNKRDWLFVYDHCDAIEFLLTRDDIDGRVFHVSADAERENMDVAKTLLRLLGKPETLLQSVPDRPGHDWRYALDSSELRGLGWKPAVTFEEGLKKTVDWYVERAGR